jgi:Rps23 Pro-64 3,4-dihydroxylase Tpa1-like proline 4-hydroxylase
MNLFSQDTLFKNNLKDLANQKSSNYQNAEPFSHIVFDDFINDSVLDEVLKEFPSVNDPQWQQYKSETENGKLASSKYELMPETTRRLLDNLNTPPFLQFLEKLTGIQGLIPDPYYTGGGMHQTKSGGWLGIHVDFNRYEQLKLYRRINVLIYLNKDWKDEYGGHLELWDDKMENCVEKVLPIYNRCAIFTTSENSHHGHPDPLTCPIDMTRKSLAWYYYTTENGEKISDEAHSTLFKARPDKDKNYKVIKIKDFIKSLIPPIVLDIVKKFR